MRDRKQWMIKGSEQILELLSDSGLALPPKPIYVNLERLVDDSPSRSSVDRALKALEEHGYIEKFPDAETMYVITEKGEQYLEGS